MRLGLSSRLVVVGLLIASLGIVGCGRSGVGGSVDRVNDETDCLNGIDDDINGKTDCADPACAESSECVVNGENCGNQRDDDGDGDIDCDDSDCTDHPLCQIGPEQCDNGVDDDRDGDIDCADSDCLNDPACVGVEQICDDGLDNDVDGFTDCLDPDCANDPVCTGQENCVNGVDDDGDGLVDCADPDCAIDPICLVPENCANGIDDDGDGLIDCADFDCIGHPLCQGSENCVNGIDDDGDGLIDCADPDCFGEPACFGPENCGNGVDDDGDGLIDCQDPDCTGSPFCFGPENCVNGVDDDGDGDVDCLDTDCIGSPFCIQAEVCTNGIDDDGDGLIDCADPDCFGELACNQPELCQNGFDDDGDGLVDCADSDCFNDPGCQGGVEICTNQVDDDNDGLADCLDPDCFVHPSCEPPGSEICTNGLDDDQDGDIDCDDSDCSSLPICQAGPEICDNQIDDDGDGAIDCLDPDCTNFPGCLQINCTTTVDFGTLAASGASQTRTIDNTNTTDVFTSGCGVPGGGEIIAHFALSGPADVKLTYSQLSGDHVFGLFRAGVAQPCNANPLGCFDPNSQQTGEFSLLNLDAGDYYLFTEAFASGLEGSVEVTLSTGQQGGVEICNNGIDDDLDGATDCADLDCATAPVCATQNCTWDIDLGTLVVDGPSETVTIDTSTAPDNLTETCAAGGGGERIIRLVLPTAAGLAVQAFQGNNYHAYGLHRDQGPGTVCNAGGGSCFDSTNRQQFLLSYGQQEKGVYYYIVDAMDGSNEGSVQLSFSAFSTRGPELCANGIDDDGDGLVDCLDPDCTGVVSCPGAVCQPEFQTGPLVPFGPGASFTVDLTTQNNDNTVSCSVGGGKDAVIELELPQVSGIGIQCTQFGDHVIGLFRKGDPRDPCDASPLACADPNSGPIGCNFIFPNQQPGTYYLVIEAFQPGDEGSMDITITATPDSALEICNNGIDDDGDGLIDCQDSNCASQPICSGATCTPDNDQGLLVKGAPPISVALNTQGAGDANSASCASGGGQDYVIGFTIAQQSDVVIDFAQFGDHVFALYSNNGLGFSCDAAPLGCQAAGGAQTGQVTFTQVDPGEYYLIVEAQAPGSEGAVILEMSAP